MRLQRRQSCWTSINSTGYFNTTILSLFCPRLTPISAWCSLDPTLHAHSRVLPPFSHTVFHLPIKWRKLRTVGKYLLHNVIYPRRCTSQTTIIHAGYANGKLSRVVPLRTVINADYSNPRKVSDRSFFLLTRCARTAEFFIGCISS